MKFLIQTENDVVTHDFSRALIEGLKFNKWLDPRFNYTIEFINWEVNTSFLSVHKDFIPSGSVEFVTAFLKQIKNIIHKPINIPEQLMGNVFTCRKVINGTEKDIVGRKFVKSNDKVKSYTEITDNAPEGNYQISDVVEIVSEWRAFIYREEMVGLQNYSGEFTIFPCVNEINAMVGNYTNSPIAYTLDVGILDTGQTVIIEVHDFFSCGLYGFADYKIIPIMMAKWYYEYIGFILKV